MRFQSEAILDGATGRWYGVIRVLNDDGSIDTIFKSENQHGSRTKAEEEVVKRMQDAVAGATEEE